MQSMARETITMAKTNFGRAGRRRRLRRWPTLSTPPSPFDGRMYQRGHHGLHGPRGDARQMRHPDAGGRRRRSLAVWPGILDDIDSGALTFDPACEDIHMFVEQGSPRASVTSARKLHTARSRNDQVALDLRMYLRSEIERHALRSRRTCSRRSWSRPRRTRATFCPATRTCSARSPLPSATT